MTNRIEDLIEKARHYEDLWHEAIDENARLQADLEKSDGVVFTLAVENERLKAEVERLTKAGDAMELLITYSGIYIDGPKSGLLKAWNAAKEGKQS